MGGCIRSRSCVPPRRTAPAAKIFVELTLRGDAVAAIRDFRHVPYVGRDLIVDLAPAQEMDVAGHSPW